MNHRQCGDSDLWLPALGLGCWPFGGGEYWGPAAQADVDAVVRFAVDQGCNYFDTAEAYNQGASEAALGQALRGIARDKVLVGTKISPSNTAPENLVEHCEASLRRLQTDYIDLYMVHWPITSHSIVHFHPEPMATPSVPDAFATLARLRQAGKIRHIGVSNFGPERLDEALATGAGIVVDELPYSLLTRGIENEILPHCGRRGVGVMGYMALMQGVLAGIYPTLGDVPVWQRRTRHFDSRRTPQCRHGTRGAEQETTQSLEAIGRIARRHGLGMAEISLRWAMARQGITCTLCGTHSIAELKQNLAAARSPLAAEIVAELDAATRLLMDALGPGFDYYEHPDNDRTR